MYFSWEVRDISFLFFVSLRRARNAARSQEKEKPAKFANGSLLGNDSRIFVQHHGAYPLSRMRPSPSSSSSLSFRPFLFFKVLPSRDAGVLHPFTFYFALSQVFGASPPVVTLCTLDFLSFTYHLDFCNNNVPPTSSIIVFLYTRLFLVFLFLCYLHFFHIAISLRALSPSITEFCTFPSGIVLRFLRRQRL